MDSTNDSEVQATARETVQDRSSFRIIHVIGTHTRYAHPNDIYVTLVIGRAE